MKLETRHQHEDIAAPECWRLLRATETGRVAFTQGSRICVFPVSYVARDRTVYFRTSPYGTAATSLNGACASFQVDEFDDFLQAGWSVLASGHAEIVEDPVLLADLWGPERPEPWAGGTRSLFIGIEVDEVTGRRVHPG